jgi:hypothetical protein
MKAKLRFWAFPAALALAFCRPAFAIAQGAETIPAAPTESVTVTGIKDLEAAVSKFVGTITVPTRVADKLARWREGVCPITVGLRPEAAKLVTKRVKDIAAIVGAPVNDKDSCPPNIEIVFTTAPQALLDNIRVMQPFLLGYHDNSAQAEHLAAVVRPIQSWYTTATEDLRGNRQVDAARTGPPLTLVMPAPPGQAGGPVENAQGYIVMTLPNATATNVTGNRLGDGLSSGFNHVLVVAEPAKLLDYEVGTLADYIAMLALSQIQPPDSCQDLPSILNLLLSSCSRTARALTSGDIAYLQALYKMTPTATFQVQRSEMMYQMGQSLEAHQ